MPILDGDANFMLKKKIMSQFGCFALSGFQPVLHQRMYSSPIVSLSPWTVFVLAWDECCLF